MMYHEGDRIILWIGEGRVRAGLDVFRSQDIEKVRRESKTLRTMTEVFGPPTCTVKFKRNWPDRQDMHPDTTPTYEIYKHGSPTYRGPVIESYDDLGFGQIQGSRSVVP